MLRGPLHSTVTPPKRCLGRVSLHDLVFCVSPSNLCFTPQAAIKASSGLAGPAEGLESLQGLLVLC